MTIKIKHKRGTASNITSANPTLAAGELAFETDTRRFKVGDGTTAWSSLAYVTPYLTATDRILGRSSSGAGAAEEITCTAFGRSVIGSADSATARTTLGLAIGTNVQAYDAELAALAGVTSAADALPYFTGSGTATTTTLSSFGRSLIDDADAASARTTLSVQPTASPAFTGRVGIGAAANAIAYVHIDQTAPSSGGVTQVIRNTVTIPSTTTDYWTFLSAPTTQAASFTLSGMRHFVVDPQGFGAGSTVTNQFGYIVESSMTGATNNYGFYSNIASGAGRFNFYANGTAANYFAGNVGVGTTAPAAPLDIGSSSGVKVFTYKSGGANAGIGTDLSGAAYECSLFAGGTADTHGRISFGRRRVDTGTYTEFVAINSSGQLLVTAGSASACGVAFSGDTNTGLAQIGGADTASLVTAGVERVRVAADGNVRIRTGADIANDFYATKELAVIGSNSTLTSGAGNVQIWTNDAQAADRGGMIALGGKYASQPDNSGDGRAVAYGVIKGAKANSTLGSPLGYLAFGTNDGTNNVERMRIDASGNVGIGISPSTLLHLKSLGVLRLQTGSVTMDCTPTAGATDSFVWNTSANCVYRWSMNGTQRMDITSAGEVLIGTTTDNGAYLLQVNSQIYATNATIATSDARFKTNVESLTDATAVIEALRPVAFDFIPHAERNFATERQVGLIAQEAQAALAGTDYADSVVAQCGDHLGLAYEKLVPVLIKALQESNARIAALEERLNHA